MTAPRPGIDRPLRRTRRLSDGCREKRCGECPFGPALCACECHKVPPRPRTWACPRCYGSGTVRSGPAREVEKAACPRCRGSGRIPER